MIRIRVQIIHDEAARNPQLTDFGHELLKVLGAVLHGMISDGHSRLKYHGKFILDKQTYDVCQEIPVPIATCLVFLKSILLDVQHVSLQVGNRIGIISERFPHLKFNSSPLESSVPKRKVIFQPPFFRGKLAVKLRGCKFSEQ